MSRSQHPLDISFSELSDRVADMPYSLILGSDPQSGQPSSYVGFCPEKVMTSTRGKTVVTERGETLYETSENPYACLDREVQTFDDDFGWAGFFSYESCRNFSDYAFVEEDDYPELIAVVFKHIVVFDHHNQTTVLHTVDHEDAIRVLSRRVHPTSFSCSSFSPQLSKDTYVDTIHRIQSYIAKGDVYQINYTYPVVGECEGDPYSLYKALVSQSPSPFSAFFRTPETCIISNSPELFIRKEDDTILTKPIKGTRPRGRSKEEDAAFRNELSSSEKDRAELLMIVDLERNDLNHICHYGTVTVDSLFDIEDYSYVFQQSSTIRGSLKTSSILDVFQALFPGGSITGAPKIRAMEIIQELEPYPRRVYTGCIGFLSKKKAVLNIAIRTLYTVDGSLVYHVGGGIVADSDPHREWEETLTKGVAIRQALQQFVKEKEYG